MVPWGYAWIQRISIKTLSKTSGTVRQLMTFYQTCQVHTPHPARCQVAVLACHTGQSKWPNDYIQHPMRQIQMVTTTIWTQSGRIVLVRETWQHNQRHLKCPQHCRWCACWWKSWGSPWQRHYHPARNCKSKQHHLQPWQVCLQVQRSQVLQWNPDPRGIQCWPKECASYYRNEATTESSRNSELPGTSQLPQLLHSKDSRADCTSESTQQEGHSLHLGKLTASSIWGNPERNHTCTCLSIFWQVQVKHHTVRCIQRGARSSSSLGWQASYLCTQEPDRLNSTFPMLRKSF